MDDINLFLFGFFIRLGFKIAFSGLLFHNQKGITVFVWQEDINVVIISDLSFTKLRLTFWNLNPESRYSGKHGSCLWSQSRFLLKSYKSLLSPEQNNSRHEFADDNVKIKVSSNIPSTFLLFKASAFLQIFFPRKVSFKFCTTW